MSGTLHTIRNAVGDFANVIGLGGIYRKAFGGHGDAVGYFKKDYVRDRTPQLPGAPTVDSADLAAQQEADSIRRRRGVLANIYGGAQNQTPTVGVKTLLGQ